MLQLERPSQLALGDEDVSAADGGSPGDSRRLEKEARLLLEDLEKRLVEYSPVMLKCLLVEEDEEEELKLELELENDFEGRGDFED
ncbi:hypothetical protein Q3G72_025254 [Acer saccharum]|nr:hypothetical protein Q3G72_025254 [Acer saccharum]